MIHHHASPCPLKVTGWTCTSTKVFVEQKNQSFETKAEHLLVSPVTEFLARLMLISFFPPLSPLSECLKQKNIEAGNSEDDLNLF